MLIDKILDERQQTHGDFSVHAFVTQEIKATIYRNIVLSLTTEQQEALDMIAHKIGRVVAGNPNHKDHWDDIAGYATLVSRTLEAGKDTKVSAAVHMQGKFGGRSDGDTPPISEDIK